MRLGIWTGLLGAIAISAFLWTPALAADYTGEGYYKVYRVRGAPVEGRVVLEGDKYVVTTASGIKMTLPKRDVRNLAPMEAPREEGPTLVGSGAPIISLDEINEIIGSHNLRLRTDELSPTEVLEPPLPLDEESLEDMLRIAGPEAKFLTTDHFVCVFTSERSLAQQMIARLEKVYKFNIIYMEQLGIPPKRPEAKLEIFFFGHFDEYDAYQTRNGFRSEGAIGFYYPPFNRSAFFDMKTWPSVAMQLKAIERKGSDGTPLMPWKERNRIKSQLEAYIEYQNVEVVQHEAAHHIHFNIGVFPRDWSSLPRWAVEGLATVFEVPPNKMGASLGSQNHFRLAEYTTSVPRGSMTPDGLKNFLLQSFSGGGSYMDYVMGNVLQFYFWNKKRDEYATFINILADRDENWRIQMSLEKQFSEFERIFGEIDEAWIADFEEFIWSCEIKWSEIPAWERQRRFGRP